MPAMPPMTGTDLVTNPGRPRIWEAKGTCISTDLSFGEEQHLVAPMKKKVNRSSSSLTKRPDIVRYSYNRSQIYLIM